ncbi:MULTISPECIES: response regulator [Methylobacterium]|jgi:CheY-like chemotaxis protein|nr:MULTISPECIES: response regulator [Methylobacterium]MBK3397081.1 response regulator [Methylobacterium ajmalii]MBK3408296.1 response regulator [Methylobacterium ajmalii]MBK3420923.1 response regulator [Methylobacterium ajmalii]MBZ6411127.1 response regulator [Methylobacterium sp.]SFE19564.1 Response regulator receiver domain-containing protein [Methylobacterium sp. yr596]
MTQPPSPQTVTVLVVDDSKLARAVAVRLLRQLKPDWAVREAANAEEAAAIAAAEPVGVALLDFNMPGKDGLALAAELRAQNPGMPIAVISANIQDEVIARARSVDATFMPKPLTGEALAGFLSGASLRLRRGAP